MIIKTPAFWHTHACTLCKQPTPPTNAIEMQLQREGDTLADDAKPLRELGLGLVIKQIR